MRSLRILKEGLLDLNSQTQMKL